VLGGCDCLEDQRLREMFVGAGIGYKVETCQLVSLSVFV
jgi:hypothetical protein